MIFVIGRMYVYILSMLYIPNNISLSFFQILFYFYAFVFFRSFPNNYWDKFVKRKVILLKRNAFLVSFLEHNSDLNLMWLIRKMKYRGVLYLSTSFQVAVELNMNFKNCT